VVGHDGDLDDLATALGIQWELQNPYISTSSPASSSSSSSSRSSPGNLLPTPPLSGLHLVRSFPKEGTVEGNARNSTLDISFLYPLYSNGTTSWSNETAASRGILQSTAVQWNGGFRGGTGTVWDNVEVRLGSTTRLQLEDEANLQNDGAVVVASLQNHIETTLQQYPGATGCWEDAATLLDSLPPLSSPSILGGNAASLWNTSYYSIGSAVVGLFVGVTLGYLWARKRLKGSNRTLLVDMVPVSQVEGCNNVQVCREEREEGNYDSTSASLDDFQEEGACYS
jgi:ABC-type glycerol-3-phosphate transport system permease component